MIKIYNIFFILSFLFFLYANLEYIRSHAESKMNRDQKDKFDDIITENYNIVNIFCAVAIIIFWTTSSKTLYFI